MEGTAGGGYSRDLLVQAMAHEDVSGRRHWCSGVAGEASSEQDGAEQSFLLS